MKKRIILLTMAALLVVPFSAFAVDLLGFRVGPAVMYDHPFTPDSEIPDEFDSSKLTFGADARFNFSLLEANTLLLVTPPEMEGGEVWTINAYLNGGLSFDVANLVKLGAFVGPKIMVEYNQAEEKFTAYENGTEILDPDLQDLLNAGVNVKLSADVLLGGISLSAFLLADTNIDFENLFDGDIENMFEGESAKVGVSALFTIF